MIKTRKVRQRLSRLRRCVEAFESRPDKPHDRIKAIDETIALILLDMPKMSGGCDMAVEKTKSDGRQLIRNIQKKLKRYRSVSGDQTTQAGKGLVKKGPLHTSSSETGSFPLSGGKGQQKSQSLVWEKGQGAKDDNGNKGQDNNDDDDDCVITMVIDKQKQAPNDLLDIGMQLKDELLWYDSSKHFDEDLLP